MGLRNGSLMATMIYCAMMSFGQFANADPVTLRLGYGNAAEEPLWLIIAHPDLAKNAGKAYKLEATRFPSSDKRAQAFEAGAIDLASGSANGIIFAAAEGITAKIIASLSRESTRGFATAFYVKDDSPIKSVKDMKGKVVGINGFSTSGELWLRTALKKDGLKESDVTVTPVSFPAMQEALNAGKVDIGQFPQPFAALLESQMKVRKIFDSKYGIPFEEELIVITAKDEFLKANAPAVRAFLADLKAATDFYIKNPREARQILINSKIVRVTSEVYLHLKDYYHEPSLRVDMDSLKKMQEAQMAAGFQKKSADIPSIIDMSYLPN